MEYGLLPVEAALSFIGILLIIYNKKQQFLSSKTILYKWFLYFSFFYGALLFGGVCLIKYTGINALSMFIWRAQGFSLFTTWIMFYTYCLTIIYNINELNLFKIIKSRFEFKLLFLFLAVYFIAIFVPVYISLFDNVDPNNIEIFTRDSSTTILILLIVSAISLFSRIIPNRKRIPREFIFATIFGCLICMGICVFHMFYHNNTFLPLAFAVFAYVLYFGIENPDIILLEETLKMEKNNVSDENKFDFFSNLNSDMNVPIDNILSVCKEVKNNGFDDSANKMDSILNYSNALLDNLNNLFDSSLINTSNIYSINYEVRDLVNDITSVLKEKIGNKKVKLCFNFSPSISSKLCGDYEKIIDIYSTLIINACECTTYGKIMVELSSSKHENQEVLNFKIMDTGEGISEEEQYNFYHNLNDCSVYLKKVKNLVDALKGKIWFKSTEKIGTTYYIQLSQKTVDSTPIGQTINKTEISSDKVIDFSKYNILIIDDDEMSLKLSEKIFKKFGFNVSISKDGNDGIIKVKSGEEFDMILVDIMMSDFSGIDVLKALKTLEDYKIPPIIAFTANALSGMKEEYLSEGFDDYLEKPIVYKDLMRIFNKYF